MINKEPIRGMYYWFFFFFSPPNFCPEWYLSRGVRRQEERHTVGVSYGGVPGRQAAGSREAISSISQCYNCGYGAYLGGGEGTSVGGGEGIFILTLEQLTRVSWWPEYLLKPSRRRYCCLFLVVKLSVSDVPIHRGY